MRTPKMYEGEMIPEGKTQTYVYSPSTPLTSKQ
jgi:hypothetical protein